MKNKYDFIFLAMVKNCEIYLPKFFNFIHKLKKKNKVCVILGEDNSIDNSIKVINKNKVFFKDLFLVNTKKISSIKERVKRISYGRQMLKDFMEMKKITAHYVVVLDMDELIKDGIKINNFLRLKKKLEMNQKSIFAVSGKTLPYYYDLLSLFIPDYYEKKVFNVQKINNFWNAYFLRKRNIYEYQIKINNFREFKCISAHNGISIYNYKDYIIGSYKNIQKSKIYSDHGNFNFSIYNKNKKMMMVCHNFILKTPKEHFPKSYFQFVLSFMLRKLHGFIK